jgi:hypothetical protein
MPVIERTGYRVQWQHPAGDWFTGDWWPDRATAEHIAGMLRDSGWCFNIRIVPWRDDR